MSKVSIIIPSRNELFLPQTVADLLAKGGDIEIIAVLDGYWPDPPLPTDKRLITLHRGRAMGMRAAINAAAEIASGKYLMKCDGHCMFGDGFDEVLQADCAENWMVIPRRYSLDGEAWDIKPDRPHVDYHYLSCPWTNKDGFSFHGQMWRERRDVRQDKLIDEEMTTQGSCWFMHRKHWQRIGPMDEASYGTFSQEPQELGLKTWLGGGQMMVNKRTWYAHLHKGKKYGRGYFLDKKEVDDCHQFSARYWTGNHWAGRQHDFEWFIDRFWPVPTWPDNWKELQIPDGYVQPSAR